MKLDSLVRLFKGGNAALASKLNNLLTEDCQILEYTDDAVLFSKGEKLVLANFVNSLTESTLVSENIIDNEVITVSELETKKSLRKKLLETISNLADENYVDAEDALTSFCEDYKIYSYLKLRYPTVFVETRIKDTRGHEIRLKATSLIPSFKAAVFSSVLMNESKKTSLEVASAVSIIEKYGLVLALGKARLLPIVEDALLSNKELAKIITESLYEVYKELREANEELQNTEDSGYDVEAGKFPDELDTDPATDDQEAPVAPSSEDEVATDYKPLDPSKLSEDDLKQLHKDTLRSVITSIKNFVVSKANDASDTAIDPNAEDNITKDLDDLDDPEITDERLSEIEGRWNPVLSYFLDSDSHQPDDDMLDTGVDAGDTEADAGKEITDASADTVPPSPAPPSQTTPAPGVPPVPAPQV